MENLNGKTIAILATDGFEQTELTEPRKMLKDAGATVHVVSPQPGEIRGWDHTDWGGSVPVDKTLDEASAADYDAVVLPGGQINPDLLRVEPKAIAFIKAFHDAGKPIGAICHAPWLLIEAGIVKGRRMTSYHSIRTDLANAGADVKDEAAVVDEGIVTSRNPRDIGAFANAVAAEVASGKTYQRAA
ncbi:ThiJ/PfpI family protein [Caenispirillum salinarum AK4]|uniref:ThiJ/PfpI family protein n=1 Tax=Caenispirillum salinarum AK4 TaxID=1238182 RepID=K9HU13_9PROT|nr:type 1 glutamine amidotransferase domain-containing protein [Caenispirillum salinarum]EKV31721.1 ThiJ/PfpI family protein [Caenispirillum salinarum AK4]